MSQSIEVGSILGGRYQVTEFVMTTAEGDLVLEGIDQVLNRSVSILVAAADNSSQLASSAREIAMDERSANVQVLDLGITDSNQTYLVANMAASADLLDLVIENDAPYVEPFYTDTLGTEIFGESRQSVPETYEDDDQYYEQLRYDDAPEEQGRIGNALASGLSGFKNRFGRKTDPQSAADSTSTESPDEDTDPQTAPTSTTVNETAPVAASTPADKSEKKPKVTKLDAADEPSVTATAALSSAELSKGNDAATKASKQAGAGAAGAAAAAAPKEKQPKTPAKAGGAAAAAAASNNGSKPKTFPAAAKGVSIAAPSVDQQDPEEDSNNKGARLLVGAVLIAVLVIAVVFAFNFLGGGGEEPVAQSPSATTEASGSNDPTEGSPSESASSLPAPVIADVSRLVPGNQSLNDETDNTLPQMIDGNPASSYNTYSYTTPNFGGFASNMVFILELEKPSNISEVTLEGLNASGGTYEILIGDSDDLGDATSVANGSFTGPSLSVPVNKEHSTGQYVFLNVTELPRRASGANPSRPYGLQIGEFSAK